MAVAVLLMPDPPRVGSASPDAETPLDAAPQALEGTVACDVTGSSRCVVVADAAPGAEAAFSAVDASGLPRETRSRLMPCSLKGFLECRAVVSLRGTRDGLPRVEALSLSRVTERVEHQDPLSAWPWRMQPAPAGATGVKDALLDWPAPGAALEVGGAAMCGRSSCVVWQAESSGWSGAHGLEFARYGVKAELSRISAADLRRMERCNEGGAGCLVKARGTAANHGRIADASIEWLDHPDPRPGPATARMSPSTPVDSVMGTVSGAFRTLGVLRGMQHQPVLPSHDGPTGSRWFVVADESWSHVAVLPSTGYADCRIIRDAWVMHPDTDIHVVGMGGPLFGPAPACRLRNGNDMLVRLPDGDILAPEPHVHIRHQW